MKNEEITKVLKEGRVFKSGSFLVRIFENKAQNKDKSEVLPTKTLKSVVNTAFLAPKKQFKTAVSRNKARRKMKAAFMPYSKKISQNNPQKSLFLVFNLQISVFDTPVKDLTVEIGNILTKSGMLQRT